MDIPLPSHPSPALTALDFGARSRVGCGPIMKIHIMDYKPDSSGSVINQLQLYAKCLK
jgi:hypothetical protein